MRAVVLNYLSTSSGTDHVSPPLPLDPLPEEELVLLEQQGVAAAVLVATAGWSLS